MDVVVVQSTIYSSNYCIPFLSALLCYSQVYLLKCARSPKLHHPWSPSLLGQPAEGEAPLCNKIPIFLIHLLFLLRRNWKKDRPHGTSQKPTDTNDTSPDSNTWDVLGPSLEGPSAPSDSGAGGRGAWRKQDWLTREVSSSLNRSWAEHSALNFFPKS